MKEKQPDKSQILKNVATRDIHIVKGFNYIMTRWSANLIFFQLDKRTTMDKYSGCPTTKWTWNSQADNR